MDQSGVMVLLAILPLLALSGCADKAGSPDDAAAVAGPASSSAVAIDFDQCLGWIFVGEIPAAWVQERLPEGYVVNQGLGIQGIPAEVPGPVPLAVSAYRCEAVILPDGTWQEDFTWAMTSVYLEAANGHETPEPDGADFYVFEVFLETAAFPAIADHFQSKAWPVKAATVDVGSGTFHVVSADSEYRLVLDDPTVDPEQTMSEFERLDRYHVGGDMASYGTLGDVEYRNFGTNFARMEVSGGFFGQMRPAEVVPFRGPAQGFGFDGPSVIEWAEP